MPWMSVQHNPSPKHVYRAPGRGSMGRTLVFFFLFPAMNVRGLPQHPVKGDCPLLLGYDFGMGASPSPLVGYNTNVRHKGKLYHIQTEDSGVKRPHVITQLFADGGRIIASEKTSYAEHVESEDLTAIVKQLMQEQHKRVFIALRDGAYDEDGPSEARSDGQSATASDLEVTTEVLEHAAARLVEGAPHYEQVRAGSVSQQRISRAPAAPFGHDVLSEKTLDEVILSYLAEDLETGT